MPYCRNKQLNLFRSSLSCLYCGSQADSKDHVPPKLLLERPFPPNLYTVPSCRSCNNGFARDEEYFLVAMSQTGFVESLLSKVSEGGIVDRALSYSPKLDDRINQALIAGEDGRVYLSPERDRLNRIAEKIAHGLYFIRYGQYPHSKFGPVGIYHSHQLPYELLLLIRESVLWPEIGSRAFERMVKNFSNQTSKQSKRWQVIQEHVFEYMFVKSREGYPRLQSVMRFHDTLWAVVGCPQPRRIKTQFK